MPLVPPCMRNRSPAWIRGGSKRFAHIVNAASGKDAAAVSSIFSGPADSIRCAPRNIWHFRRPAPRRTRCRQFSSALPLRPRVPRFLQRPPAPGFPKLLQVEGNGLAADADQPGLLPPATTRISTSPSPGPGISASSISTLPFRQTCLPYYSHASSIAAENSDRMRSETLCEAA